MYTACLHCHASLGRNDAIGHFPVGRTLAFDGARGRLWVVCSACARWNLTPLEERWEAIEEAERLFRRTPLRVHTEEIGLARLPEGLELIRIGDPQRPEFAAWRYGDQLGRRRRRALLAYTTGGLLAGAGIAGGVATGILSGLALAFPPGLIVGGNLAWRAYRAARDYGRPLRVPGGAGRIYTVFGANLRETTLRAGAEGEGWLLSLRHVNGFETLSGDAARRALSVLMLRVNPWGAARDQVQIATDLITQSGGPGPYLRRLSEESERRSADYMKRRAAHRSGTAGVSSEWRWPLDRNVDSSGAPVNLGALGRFSWGQRLALEMAVHEAAERRAMEGELAMLHSAWKEAEEIAAISDRLLVPRAVEKRLAGMEDPGARE